MDDVDNINRNKRVTYWFYWILIIISFICLFYLVAYSRDIQTTTCRLAKQLLLTEQRVCIYVGANHTEYRESVPLEAGECPREIRCKYRPNEKPFNLKNVVKSIKDSFK
jgi:hypothetical protein|tara:strand:- start:335 stop:661 length:327 start_codon:yes stop_codon:yes gene_type:complete